MPEEPSPLLKVILDKMDVFRDTLKEVGFKPMAVAYPRKKLDAAEEKGLRHVIAYLLILEKKINEYKNCPVFPGVKSLEHYQHLGIKGSKEQIRKENAKKDIREFWKVRPSLLRKIPKKVKQ